MLSFFEHFFTDLVQDVLKADNEILLLSLIVLAAIIVIDAATMSARRRRKASGLGGAKSVVSIDGSKTLAVREYVSEMQGLAGKPDAVISEDGFLIPVERKPLARKIRDRHIAQILVYMRLVEEFEGKKPPYGYLILGANCRQFKIPNSDEKQAWLQKMLDEMHGILGGTPSQPSPHPKKCQKCTVRASCQHKIGKKEHENPARQDRST